MDAQKTLKKYILPKGIAILTVISLLLVAAALVFTVLGIAAKDAVDDTATLFYPAKSKTGTTAYIDVVGVSDWLYKNGDSVYYSVMDTEGYLYTVRLNDPQFKELSAQFDYWMNGDENAVPPAAFRLEGVVKNVNSDIRSALAECWEMSAMEFDAYFGTKLLDATASAAVEALAPWLFGALTCGLFGIVFLLVFWNVNRTAKKCLRRLEELCLTERAAQQLDMTESNTVIGKNRGMLSRDFLFGKGTGMVVPYSDILWAYQLDRKRNFIPINSYLMVGTLANGVVGAVDLNRSDMAGVIAEALAVISQRNPDTMIGHTRDFVKAFSNLRKGK